jgi:hypothetical protein
LSKAEKPSKLPIKSVESNISISRTTVVPTDDRRRSQRVMMRIGVVLRFAVDGKEIDLRAHTVAVNIHGAMICAGQSIPAGTVLDVEHRITGERISGSVTRHAQSSPDGFLIPVEFTAASPNFWRISFPPSDWKPIDD